MGVIIDLALHRRDCQNCRWYGQKDRATKGQVQLIYSLAERLGWSEEPKRLTAFLEKQYGISHPSFLDRRSTNSCIAALKAMAAGGRGERKGGACGQVDGQSDH